MNIFIIWILSNVFQNIHGLFVSPFLAHSNVIKRQHVYLFGVSDVFIYLKSCLHVKWTQRQHVYTSLELVKKKTTICSVYLLQVP